MRRLIRSILVGALAVMAAPALARDDLFDIAALESQCEAKASSFSRFAPCLKKAVLEGRKEPLPAERFLIGYLDAAGELAKAKLLDEDTLRHLYRFGRTAWATDRAAGREGQNPWRTVAIFVMTSTLVSSHNRLPVDQTYITYGSFYEPLGERVSPALFDQIEAADRKCFAPARTFSHIAACLREALVPDTDGGRTRQDQYFSDHLDVITELADTGVLDRESIAALYSLGRASWALYRANPQKTSDAWALTVALSLDHLRKQRMLPTFTATPETLQFIDELAAQNTFAFTDVFATCPGRERPSFGHNWSVYPPAPSRPVVPVDGAVTLYCADDRPATWQPISGGAPGAMISYRIRVPLVR